jgi:hypothetical protein
VRARKQAGHMDASDLIRALPKLTLRGGGRPHMGSGHSLKQPKLRLDEGKTASFGTGRDRGFKSGGSASKRTGGLVWRVERKL